MSELHVRQIRAALNQQFRQFIDLSDIANHPQDQQDKDFFSRAQLAFVFAYLANIQADEAAMTITDGSGDNGIDGVLYIPNERVLYIGQSKWRNDGLGSIDRADVLKFTKGFRDLINARWAYFNQKIQQRASEIETALNDASTRIILVVAYTGQELLSKDVDQDIKDFLQEMNDPIELVNVHILRQANIYSIVAQGINGVPIDLEVALYEWGQVRDPYMAFYGQVSVSDVARWYEKYQNQLFTPNIRMFLGATEVNTTIVDTLLKEPSDFWYFNNGISALSRTIKKKPIGGNTRETGIFECHDLRIVNGAQTVGAIASAAARNPDTIALARVPIKLISLENCPADFDRKVTRYNNTQNRIDRRDFVALDVEQERIRGELQLEGITYIYKSGETLTPSEKCFSLDEATVARACLQRDVALTVQAKREIGKLWEDIDKPPYKTLFNSSVTGPNIWRSVQIVREIDKELSTWRSSPEGRIKLLAIHGNRFITHLVFHALPSTVLQTYQPLDTDARGYIMQAVVNVFGKILILVETEYPDSYLAQFFKNATKCQYIKKLFDESPIP